MGVSVARVSQIEHGEVTSFEVIARYVEALGGRLDLVADFGDRTVRLLCMLAAYLTWHLRQAWAPLTYTDQDSPAQPNPVAPARRSPAADAKASRQHDENGRPYRSFRGLLAHLATLTRNQVRFAGAPTTVPVLTEPTSEQRQAFDLIGAPIPLTLNK
jgi:hypothetical protein